ncbi:MAG: hypothetical protein ABIP68_09640 [Ferruginibacter sp.]
MKKVKEIKLDVLENEEMYCFVAPDGSPQIGTLAPDFATCIGMTELYAISGMVQTPKKLFEQGFVILPVKVTITQNGNEETAFKKHIKKL